MTVAEVTRPEAGSPSPDARPLMRAPAPLPIQASDLDAGTMLAVSVAQADRYGDRVALTVKDERGSWYPVSWREQHESAAAFAAALVHAGIAAGDRMALLAENRLEWLHCDFGAPLAAVVVVPIYASSTPEMVEQILVDRDATAVICSTPDQSVKIDEIRDQLTALRVRVLMEGVAGGLVALQHFTAEATAHDVQQVARRAPQATHDAVI